MNRTQNLVFKIAGYDVSKWVLDLTLASGVEEKPEWGGMPDTPRLEFELRNDKNQFSPFSDTSIFYNKKIQDLTVELTYVQGSSSVLEWSGVIEQTMEDYQSRKVKVIGISDYQKKLDLPALISTSITTPSALSKIIFNDYGIEVDETSYSKANTALSGLVSAQVDPNLLDSNITLYEVQKQLATAGYGRIYPSKGKMKYEVFDTTSPTVTLSLSDRDIMSPPNVEIEERQETFYKVEYIDDSVNSGGYITGKPIQTLSFGANSPVKITSQSAALQIGDQWESISRLKTRRITFGIKHEIGALLSLDSFFSFNWPKGGFFSEDLEVVRLDRTDDRYTTITGRTI